MAGEGIVKPSKTHSKMRAMKRFEDLNADYHLPMTKTGLPFIVWISPRGNARHDVRVEVALLPKAGKPELASVAILPDVRVVKGMMGSSELAWLRRWVDLNRDVIVKFWNDEIRHWNGYGQESRGSPSQPFRRRRPGRAEATPQRHAAIPVEPCAPGICRRNSSHAAPV